MGDAPALLFKPLIHNALRLREVVHINREGVEEGRVYLLEDGEDLVAHLVAFEERLVIGGILPGRDAEFLVVGFYLLPGKGQQRAVKPD